MRSCEHLSVILFLLSFLSNVSPFSFGRLDIPVADPGFLEGGGAPVWIGGARSDGTAVCGRKLKKWLSLSKIEGRTTCALWIRHCIQISLGDKYTFCT